MLFSYLFDMDILTFYLTVSKVVFVLPHFFISEINHCSLCLSNMSITERCNYNCSGIIRVNKFFSLSGLICFKLWICMDTQSLKQTEPVWTWKIKIFMDVFWNFSTLLLKPLNLVEQRIALRGDSENRLWKVQSCLSVCIRYVRIMILHQ